MKHALTFLALLTFASFANAATRNNDDSCDIAVMPAATLLLPYFEVNVEYPTTGETTLFTITNVTPEEQIAHVTLWTDWSYPVVSFNVYLTGYDQQGINLYDVLARGRFAPELGTGTDFSDTGDFSVRNQRLDLTDCAEIPAAIPEPVFRRMQAAFTTGLIQTSNACMQPVGGQHKNAIGYATIDVVRSCTTGNPTTPGYLTNDILWDNALTGDYQQFSQPTNHAEGGPMVHIRAVPEGGTAAQRRNMPESYQISSHRTFYSRFLPANMHTFDGRQPLPSLFAARWIYSNYTNEFKTKFKVWREALTGSDAQCGDYAKNVAPIVEAIVFDEDENPKAVFDPDDFFEILSYLPSASLTGIEDHSVFPHATTGAISGWVYLNLNTRSKDDTFARQAWVITSLRAWGNLSVDADALVLGNGCTPPVGESEVSKGNGTVIGPAPNVNP